MASDSREFFLTDGERPPGDDIPPVADDRIRIAGPAATRRLRRTWLDTFDWRLYRAGLTLEYRVTGRHPELLLAGRDGPIVASGTEPGTPQAPLRWPRLAADLPYGPLRERVIAVSGIRALLPVARAVSSLTERRAVNTDDKTIARLAVEQMTVPGADGPPPPRRITVRPLRGYQAQADRLADAIARAPGVRPAEQADVDLALAAAGRTPGDYTGKINVELTSEMPAQRALAEILNTLLATVLANLDGTIRDIDTEFLHDLRIAIRRTRTVLKIAGPTLPADMTARYRPEFKWLGDLTTPTRDLDVFLLGFPALASVLVSGTWEELAPFRDRLASDRALSQRRLARGLRSDRFTRLTTAWHQDLERLASSPRSQPAAGTFAARRIARVNRRVLRAGYAVDASSPPQALHNVRKRCKELRYALEVFASLHDPDDHRRALKELKALQNCLGEFQDATVQLAGVRDFATAMVADRTAPAETLLAMGEISAEMARRRRAAVNDFSARFADFSSPRGQARMTALTKAARKK